MPIEPDEQVRFTKDQLRIISELIFELHSTDIAVEMKIYLTFGCNAVISLEVSHWFAYIDAANFEKDYADAKEKLIGLLGLRRFY